MPYSSPSITPSGTTFAQLVSGGLSGVIDRLVAAQVATADPTAAATAAATGGGATGGLLAAGTYYFVFTESNGIGETKISPEGAQLTVGATNIPRFTFPALKAGNVARRLYLGAVNGPSGGPYTLYSTGITTTTFDAAVAKPANSYAVGPSSVNSTSLVYTASGGVIQNKTLELIKRGKARSLEQVHNFASDVVRNFTQGDPVSWEGEMMKLRHAHTAFLIWATALAEIGALIDANPGTLRPAATPGGPPKMVRTQP